MDNGYQRKKDYVKLLVRSEIEQLKKKKNYITEILKQKITLLINFYYF